MAQETFHCMAPKDDSEESEVLSWEPVIPERVLVTDFTLPYLKNEFVGLDEWSVF